MAEKMILANDNESDELTTLYYKLGNAYFEATHGKTELKSEVEDCVQKIEELKKAEEDQELEKEGLKRCPECGEKLTLISRFCNMCGHKFDVAAESTPAANEPAAEPEDDEDDFDIAPEFIKKAAPEPEPAPAPAPAPVVNETPLTPPPAENNTPLVPVICPYCGAKTESDAVFCPECGKKLI